MVVKKQLNGVEALKIGMTDAEFNVFSNSKIYSITRNQFYEQKENSEREPI